LTRRSKVLTIYTDGVARGNPGEGGYGVIIKGSDGNIVEEIGGYIGETTNNFAEYSALVTGLKASMKYRTDKVEVFSDSELMVRQLNGVYKVKSESLIPMYKEAKSIMSLLGDVKITHIPREKNKEADILANKAVDKKMRTEVR
jgi:ribonuclease HI